MTLYKEISNRDFLNSYVGVIITFKDRSGLHLKKPCCSLKDIDNSNISRETVCYDWGMVLRVFKNKEPSSILVKLLVSSYDIDYFNSERRPLSAKEVSKLV